MANNRLTPFLQDNNLPKFLGKEDSESEESEHEEFLDADNECKQELAKCRDKVTNLETKYKKMFDEYTQQKKKLEEAIANANKDKQIADVNVEAISNYILSSERDKAKINELESEITNLLQKGQLIYYYRWVEKNIRNVNVNDEDRDIFKMLENILIDEDDLEKAIEILEDWYKIFISLKGTFKPPETFLDTIKNKLKSAIQGTKERLTDIWTKEQLTDPLTDYWTKQLKNIEARHLAEADLIQPGMPDTRNVPAELLKTYPEHIRK